MWVSDMIHFPDPRWQSKNEQMRELVGGRELGSIPLPQRYKALPEPQEVQPSASEISRTLAFLEQEKE